MVRKLSHHVDETGAIEDLGSVGDWRLPEWMPRISGMAWLFIGLAILSVVAQVAPFVSGLTLASSFRSGALFTAIARSLPILIPVAALWRTGRPRRRSLRLGSIAVGIGAFLGSALPERWSSVDPVFGGGGGWQAYDRLDVLWMISFAFTFAGPVLLGNVIRGPHDGTSTRRAIGAGIAVTSLTIGYLAMTAGYPMDLYHRYVTDPSFQGGGLMLYGMPDLRSVVVPALVAWAYFAWATLTAEANGGRRAAWIMARTAVIIQQGLVALSLVTMAFWFFIARPGEPTQLTDAIVWASGAVYLVAPVILSAASVLLIAAFAAGLGSPRDVELDGKRIELEPLPNPG